MNRSGNVRMYVDIPERDANCVRIGSEARGKFCAHRGE